jgi:hypothetical protein
MKADLKIVYRTSRYSFGWVAVLKEVRAADSKPISSLHGSAAGRLNRTATVRFPTR